MTAEEWLAMTLPQKWLRSLRIKLFFVSLRLARLIGGFAEWVCPFDVRKR
jgi:hypothetical protein